MKTHLNFFLFFLIASLSINAQTWTLMDSVSNSNSVGSNYYDFTWDGTKGIISSGWVYRITTNGGVNWSADKDCSVGELRVVNIIDNNVVFGAQNSHLYRSTDFCSTWSEIISMTGNINDIKFFGNNGIAVSSDGYVAYSTDAGTSWTKLVNTPHGDLTAINKIEILSPSVAYISGSNELSMKTTDGGQTWINATGTLTGHTFYSVTGGCYSNGTNIFKTTDGAATWTQVTTTSTIPNNVYCLNATTYYGTRDNNIYKSTDGGVTWTLNYTAPFVSNNINNIKFSGTTGYGIVNNTGGGSRWIKIIGMEPFVPENNFTSQNIVLYPNPSNGFFEIMLEEKLNEPVGIRVVDIEGKEIYNKKVTINGNVLPISVNELKAGMYFLEIQTKSKNIVKHFVLN